MGAHNISNLFIYYTINLMFSIFLSPSVKIERGFLYSPLPIHNPHNLTTHILQFQLPSSYGIVIPDLIIIQRRVGVMHLYLVGVCGQLGNINSLDALLHQSLNLYWVRQCFEVGVIKYFIGTLFDHLNCENLLKTSW